MAGELDPRPGLRRERRALRAVADEHEASVGNRRPDRRPGAQEHVLTLLPRQPADADGERAGREPEPRPRRSPVVVRCRRERVEVHGVRDDGVAAAYPRPLAGFALSLADADDDVGPAVCEPLPTERRGAHGASDEERPRVRLEHRRQRGRATPDRPASPAFDDWRWTRSGATAWTMRRRRAVSPRNPEARRPSRGPILVTGSYLRHLTGQRPCRRTGDDDVVAAPDLVGRELADDERDAGLGRL